MGKTPRGRSTLTGGGVEKIRDNRKMDALRGGGRSINRPYTVPEQGRSRGGGNQSGRATKNFLGRGAPGYQAATKKRSNDSNRAFPMTAGRGGEGGEERRVLKPK